MKLKFFFDNFQILGSLGCQGWVVIPQNVKKSKSRHPNADPDSTFHPDADSEPDPSFQIKAQTLVKVLE